MAFVVVNRNPDRAVGGEQAAEYFEPLLYEGKPKGMLHHIVVVAKSGARIIRRINIDTLNFSGELVFECFEGE
jgi:hypothetical protein